MHGNADVPRNVLENVVFERHLSDNEGQWRIHAKLPSVAYEREPLKRVRFFSMIIYIYIIFLPRLVIF